MRIFFEIKPTSHESECCICDRKIEKGEKCLKAVQAMYPGTRIGRVCIKCIKKEVSKK